MEVATPLRMFLAGALGSIGVGTRQEFRPGANHRTSRRRRAEREAVQRQWTAQLARPGSSRRIASSAIDEQADQRDHPDANPGEPATLEKSCVPFYLSRNS